MTLFRAYSAPSPCLSECLMSSQVRSSQVRTGDVASLVPKNQPPTSEIPHPRKLTREATLDPACRCGHDRRLHGPTRCHWLDCACLSYVPAEVRR